MELTGKVIAITGASGGIGSAMAQAFAAHGCTLALIDVSQATLLETCEAFAQQGVRAYGYACDVTQEDQVITTFERVVSDLGRLDVLINNAGILRDALLVKVIDGKVQKKMSLAEWNAVLNVNLTGVFLCGREAAAQMVTLGNGGLIVNISSIARQGNIGQTNYTAAKAGVAAMAVVWAKELGRYGIRACAIAPGFIATDLLKGMKPEVLQQMVEHVPMHRCGSAAEVAHAAIFLAENDYMSGRIVELDGGLRI